MVYYIVQIQGTLSLPFQYFHSLLNKYGILSKSWGGYFIIVKLLVWFSVGGLA